MSDTLHDDASFGARLRAWRSTRGVSQLKLANHAAISARHLSFVESGRSTPSPGMVLRLADALEVPLRDRNALLMAAGHAPRYAQRALVSSELATFRVVVDRILAQHEPYPGVALDRAWRLVRSNEATRQLFPEARLGDCWLETFVGSPLFAALENRDEVTGSLLSRIHEECATFARDAEMDALRSRAEALLGTVPPLDLPESGHTVLTPRFRVGATVAEMVSVVSRFTAARDITLDELRVELTFPINPAAEAMFDRN